jgi:hypothetical protein
MGGKVVGGRVVVEPRVVVDFAVVRVVDADGDVAVVPAGGAVVDGGRVVVVVNEMI